MAYDLHGLYNQISLLMHSRPYIQLEELSQRLCVERHTIEKSVKEATGKTFRELRSSMRLARATQVLGDNPTQSIKEIAYHLGYNSQRSFCRFIKTTTGFSPKELRERNNMARGAAV